MATITLYAHKISQMSGMLREAKQTVNNYKAELLALQRKTSLVQRSVCDLDDVSGAIQSSTRIQEQKADSLEVFDRNSEQFIEDTIRTDRNVADTIKKRKENFYDKYYYLKPECEKSRWEKFKDGCKKVGEWCKEHWKAIVTVVIVVAAIAILVFFPAAAPFLVLAAKGALIGAASGGILGGLSSLLSGGSFLEGFEDGAFSGAIGGAIFGGLGGAGQMFGKAFGGSCKIFEVIGYTAKISGTLTAGMGAFDLFALGMGMFDPSNPLVVINQKLHSSKLYNGFQFAVCALAAFSGMAYQTMKKMPKTCFVAGTMIVTAEGLVAIENIKAGDKVLSTDTGNFASEEKTVLETYVRKVQKLVHLTVNGKVISTTVDHPFYVKDIGFVDAGNLQTRDKLVDSDGKIWRIEKIEHEITTEPTTVYNFQVEDYHTYHVGEMGVLVHNASVTYSKDGTPLGRMELAGKKHPVTGVEFDSNGFPKFESKYDMQLAPEDYLKSRGTHFDRAGKKLYNDIMKDSNLRSQFTEQEIAIFKDGGVPKKYTWHHNQETGKLQLVNRKIHRKTGHVGGFTIWGPGN